VPAGQARAGAPAKATSLPALPDIVAVSVPRGPMDPGGPLASRPRARRCSSRSPGALPLTDLCRPRRAPAVGSARGRELTMSLGSHLPSPHLLRMPEQRPGSVATGGSLSRIFAESFRFGPLWPGLARAPRSPARSRSYDRHTRASDAALLPLSEQDPIVRELPTCGRDAPMNLERRGSVETVRRPRAGADGSPAG
jgi:hypothetical protein